MNKESYLLLTNWFYRYVEGFYSANPDVQSHVILKKEHTARVCENMRRIGRSLKLNSNQMLIAGTVALLHDIGRFSQYVTYHTFNDFLSENHAVLGVKILDETNVLGGIADSERQVIKKAVLYHNCRELPEEEDLLFARMIRDADKLDIFEMIVTADLRIKMPKSPEIGTGEGYSDRIVEDLLYNRLARYEDIRTEPDQTLFRISWLYNIYFTDTFRTIKKEQYLKRMLAELPQTDDIKKISRHVDAYLNAKCAAA